MDTITKLAYAKINLTLDVISKLDNGYHELKMIMQQISMHDVVTLSILDEDTITLDCNKNITQIKDNIVYKACELVKNKYNIKKGVHIDLEKNIFLAAGLAGGSTDCAAAIVGMNELFELGLSKKELMDIGGELGKDVVYCINGGLCIATGDGTTLEEIEGYSKTYMVVANPNIEVSTKDVFTGFKFEEQVKTNYEEMFSSIKEDNIEGICKNLNNMLETVTIKMHPIIGEIKDCLNSNGAIGSLMSGSGATVYAFFENEEAANVAKSNLLQKYQDILAEVCYTK